MANSPSPALWTWSLDVYGRGPVARLCLDLQDSFGANVNVVLGCCWSAHALDLELGPDQLADLLKDLAPWSASVTQPLRNARRALKTAPAPGTGTNEPGSNLRDLVKKAELNAEQVEQAFLEEALAKIAAKAGNRPSQTAQNPQIALANLDAYGRLLHITDNQPEWRNGCRDLVRELFTRSV